MADPRPPLTLSVPTLGGKQIWADELVFRGYRIQRNVIGGQCRLLGPRNGRICGGTFDVCLERFEALREQRGLKRGGSHLVLLLHGIFRAKEAFHPMRRALHRAGYEAEAINYPSTRGTIESHADQVERLLEHTRDVSRLSLVCHSMGGLVARELLARESSWRRRLPVHRLVMIATPNQGAHMANHLLPLWAFRRLAGPAAAQLTTDYAPVLAPPSVPFGIVAGVKGDGRGYNPLLEGEDDMTVSLSSTHLPGAEDTLQVRAIHTFILQHPDVIAGTLRYLETGRFTP